MGTTGYYALQGALPMWTGCLINGFFAYGMFSVAHDGLHRAISSNSFVNELVGGIGLLFLAPLCTHAGDPVDSHSTSSIH